MQNNLAMTYRALGRHEEALRLRRDVYFGYVKLFGEEHESTLVAANNYASSLLVLDRFAETKALMRKMIPAARRILGINHDHTLRMRTLYAATLYEDSAATLDDLREAVSTLEDTERTAKRVLGGAHPLVATIEREMQDARAALRTRETPSGN